MRIHSLIAERPRLPPLLERRKNGGEKGKIKSREGGREKKFRPRYSAATSKISETLGLAYDAHAGFRPYNESPWRVSREGDRSALASSRPLPLSVSLISLGPSARLASSPPAARFRFVFPLPMMTRSIARRRRERVYTRPVRLAARQRQRTAGR